MADLVNFVTLLNGKFDNKDQFEKISKTNPQYPYAKHINTICNSKIANLPNGFEGVFMIEESYYSVQELPALLHICFFSWKKAIQ